jgi:hypothetical protein
MGAAERFALAQAHGLWFLDVMKAFRGLIGIRVQLYPNAPRQPSITIIAQPDRRLRTGKAVQNRTPA